MCSCGNNFTGITIKQKLVNESYVCIAKIVTGHIASGGIGASFIVRLVLAEYEDYMQF